MKDVTDIQNLKFPPIISLLVSFFIPLVVGLSFYFLIHDKRFYDEQLHASFEAGDALASLILALFIYIQKQYEKGEDYYRWVTSSLACIGILGLLSPLWTVFPQMRWARTIGHLVGALIIMFLWLPNSRFRSWLNRRSFLVSALLLTAAVTVLAINFNDLPVFALPEEGYTPLLRVMNVFIGFFLITGALFFLTGERLKLTFENLALGNYFILLGTTRIILAFSERWNPTWWLLYGLRLAGVVVVFYYMFSYFRQILAKAISLNENLEKQVIERTANLNEALAHAEESNRLKSAFLANMSHEIRTPLGIVLGFTEFLRDPSLSEEEKDNYFGVIQRNGEQLSNLINDILDISKIEAGLLSVDVKHFSLRELVAEVITSLKLKSQEKSIALSYTVHDVSPVWMDSDPTRLRQILINIIGNAIKFTDTGSVHVDVVENQNKVHIMVKDTGIGLTQEQQSKLFKPFVQADGSFTRTHGGTGLGLVLSKRIAMGLGGDVKIKSSAPGQGSTFEIVVSKNISKEIDVSLQGLSPEEDLKGLKILVVDDSPEFLALTTRILASHRALVQTSENGSAAVQRALKEDFDVILMDLRMPVMDGLTATEELRKFGFKKPIIAVTAPDNESSQEECKKVGCTDEIFKPIQAQQLIKVINQYSHTA
jgi:signal transduction histidine kinase